MTIGPFHVEVIGTRGYYYWSLCIGTTLHCSGNESTRAAAERAAVQAASRLLRGWLVEVDRRLA